MQRIGAFTASEMLNMLNVDRQADSTAIFSSENPSPFRKKTDETAISIPGTAMKKSVDKLKKAVNNVTRSVLTISGPLKHTGWEFKTHKKMQRGACSAWLLRPPGSSLWSRTERSTGVKPTARSHRFASLQQGFEQ